MDERLSNIYIDEIHFTKPQTIKYKIYSVSDVLSADHLPIILIVKICIDF